MSSVNCSVARSASGTSNMPATCWTRKESWIGQESVSSMVAIVVNRSSSGGSRQRDWETRRQGESDAGMLLRGFFGNRTLAACRLIGSTELQYGEPATEALAAEALEKLALLGFVEAMNDDVIELQ